VIKDVLGFPSILVKLVVHEPVVQLGHGTLCALTVVEDIAALFLVDAGSTVEQGSLKTQSNGCTGRVFDCAASLLYADLKDCFATDACGPRSNGRVSGTPECVLDEDGLVLVDRLLALGYIPNSRQGIFLVAKNW
jgi:hypothetical protein